MCGLFLTVNFSCLFPAVTVLACLRSLVNVSEIYISFSFTNKQTSGNNIATAEMPSLIQLEIRACKTTPRGTDDVSSLPFTTELQVKPVVGWDYKGILKILFGIYTRCQQIDCF